MVEQVTVKGCIYIVNLEILILPNIVIGFS